ncbi:hypothetical protein BHE74_00012233 [Ensete ventricosum]|nr:hypothetical protein BHE74_00012233 [Ensete ventricosum]
MFAEVKATRKKPPENNGLSITSISFCRLRIRSIHEKGSKLWTARTGIERTTGKGVPYQALSTKASNREIIAFSLVGEVGTHRPTGGKRIPRHAKKRVQTPLLLFASDIDANGEAMKRERRPDETDSDDERGVLPEKKAALDGESGGDANEIIICKVSRIEQTPPNPKPVLSFPLHPRAHCVIPIRVLILLFYEVKMSNKRRVTVRKWKAVAVVDVRELYFKKGKPHPGKKGLY